MYPATIASGVKLPFHPMLGSAHFFGDLRFGETFPGKRRGSQIADEPKALGISATMWETAVMWGNHGKLTCTLGLGVLWGGNMDMITAPATAPFKPLDTGLATRSRFVSDGNPTTSQYFYFG